MIWKIILALILLALIVWAVRTKVFLKRRRSEKQIEGAVDSPASLAMGEIVAVAGGIYLSLVMVASFLRMDLPEKISIANMAVDPIALSAVVLALLQPIAMSIYYRLKK